MFFLQNHFLLQYGEHYGKIDLDSLTKGALTMFKRFLYILALVLLALCLCFSGCTSSEENEGADTEASGTEGSNSDTGSGVDTTQSSDTGSGVDTTQSSDTGSSVDTTQSSDTVSSSDTEQGGGDTPPDEGERPLYYVADVIENINVASSPYTGGNTVGGELSGVYYSCASPGAEPVNDDTGKIWLTLKPLKDLYVSKVIVNGTFSHVESLEGDVYCIHGVGSDLTVEVKASRLINVSYEIFESYGYGITEDGKMVVSWSGTQEMPLRYVEVRYNDGTKDYVEYLDASTGTKELFSMVEGEIYTVTMHAIAGKAKGTAVEVKGCYMSAPKDVPFPRVEITTQGFVWPSCDFVGSPEGCWGAGITNAEYEQCIITLYNEENQVVYSSSLDRDEGTEFLGAKMKIRGNTSARYAFHARYPYKIKLDKKADLLAPFIQRGEKAGYADKNWLLLNYGQYGYRICGDAVADAVGTEWSPDYCYVSLYVNGEYRGLYVLSESVKEGNGAGEEQWRVPVDEDGFVFECDAYWWNEELSFDTPLTKNTPMHFTFKYPDSDKLTAESAEIEYLRSYLIRFEEALMKNDDSYLDYIDLDSFVKWLLVADFLCINDGGGCNLFLYKKDSTDNSKIAMGPNWDFDSFMGNTYGLATIRLKWDTAPFYYQHLIEKESFQKRYKELFWELKDSLVGYVENAFLQVDEEAHTILLQYDNSRFGTSLKTLSTRKSIFLEWLEEHIAWMEQKFK